MAAQILSESNQFHHETDLICQWDRHRSRRHAFTSFSTPAPAINFLPGGMLFGSNNGFENGGSTKSTNTTKLKKQSKRAANKQPNIAQQYTLYNSVKLDEIQNTKRIKKIQIFKFSNYSYRMESRQKRHSIHTRHRTISRSQWRHNSFSDTQNT